LPSGLERFGVSSLTAQVRRLDPPSWRQFLLQGFDLVAAFDGHDADAGPLCERRDDLAGETENRGLVRRAVADDKGAAVVGQAVEHAAERGTEPLRVLRDELGIGLA
jgi:hypothetical protein